MSEEESLDIDHLCRLSRLCVEEGERESLKEKMGDVLSWVGCLGEVDTEGVEEVTSASFEVEALRKDEVDDGGDAESVLANAPERLMNFYVVPKVVE